MHSQEEPVAQFLRYLSTASPADPWEVEFAMHLESEFAIALIDSEIDKLADALRGSEADQASASAPAIIKQLAEQARARVNRQN